MTRVTIGESRLEATAAKAVERSSLGSFNLAGARGKLTELLAQVGRTQEFSTYTKHDISHIDALLMSADWLIPEATWEKITVADALVITLSMYLHDLGMLVTKDEYSQREETDFPAFRETLLQDDSPRGVDFRDRLSALEEVDREHFIYEEFVRVNHAGRIETWIQGHGYEQFGRSQSAVSLVQEVLRDLSSVIKSDIALVARSHHSDDLDDLAKYKTNRSYGVSRDDEANLHYAAIVLRTADLIHMTSDRTPTVQYRLSSPTDPLGQREWRKQAAVRAVKPSKAEKHAQNTIEVHATFDDPEGYFALMEYLDYCDSQLKKSARWVLDAAETDAAAKGYAFHWQRINREQIEAVSFNTNQFSFSFDQQKVLDLLTGHTLYNDASVAVRELAQNAVDAVRLYRHLCPEVDHADPDVVVEYDSTKRLLRIRDRGTGMTEQVLQDYFLKVGSSSYQAKEFIEQHPSFASISRFGIGVLSAFMIADEVRLTTIAMGERVGRELVLKSVHGRYLMRDLEVGGEVAARLGTHGTEIELNLRASSEFRGSIVDLLRYWLLIPRCSVVARIDDNPEIPIGWSDSVSALEGLLALRGTTAKVRVSEQSFDGIQVALAELWNPYFREWEFFSIDEQVRVRRSARGIAQDGDDRSAELHKISGVSVQGVRVTNALPGWSEAPVILVDVSGIEAPRTNVARSDLEAGPALDRLIEVIYKSFVNAISGQIPELAERASLRFALKEARHLFRSAVESERGTSFSKPRTMQKILSDFALHPVEVNSILEARSVTELSESGFSVLVGPAAEDAARFMDWLPEPKGLMAILREGGLLKGLEQSDRPLLGEVDALFGYQNLLWRRFSPSRVRSLEGGRSLLLDFEPAHGGWTTDVFDADFLAYHRLLIENQEAFRYATREYSNYYCEDGSVVFEGLPNDAMTVFVGTYRLHGPDSQFSQLFSAIKELPSEDASKARAILYAASSLVGPSSFNQVGQADARFAARIESIAEAEQGLPLGLRTSLIDLVRSAHSMPVWSTSIAWTRREDSR